MSRCTLVVPGTKFFDRQPAEKGFIHGVVLKNIGFRSIQ
jgi:hypothetical protein